MNLSALSRSDRLNIYRQIDKTEFLFSLWGGDLISFLQSITDLYGLPSTDSRFHNLYSDLKKHIVDNDDYSLDEVLLGKVDVLKDGIFEKFLLELLNQNWYRDAPEKYDQVVETLRQALNPFNLRIQNHVGDDDWRRGYIVEVESRFSLGNLDSNGIPIFIDLDPSYPSNAYGNHHPPATVPALVLAFDSGWNDYFQYYTQFESFYYSESNEVTYVGKTKIMIQDEFLKNKEEAIKIKDYLPGDEVMELSDRFCSLGQSEQFYRKLRDTIGDEHKLRNLLWAIRDVGMFPTLQEKYEKEMLWQSLTREKTAQRMLRHAPDVIRGETTFNYDFEYIFRPPYCKDPNATVNVKFSFISDEKCYNQILPTRLIALIGKNGSGKTRLLSSIPQSLYWLRDEDFNGRMPRFNKIIALSNSHYDNFDIPFGRADFNYIYCGLSKIENAQRMPLDSNSIIETILTNCNQIRRENVEILKKAMAQSADRNIVDEIFDAIEQQKIESIKERMAAMSSGELGMLYLFSSLLANIRFDSLVLFDEPENHLHPNSVVHTISTLYRILKKYDSYAIVATHSPIVIEAIRGENVLKVSREGDFCAVRKIGMDSLGANLSDISDHVFGTMELPQHYKEIVRELNNYKFSPDKIETLIQSGSLPLSLPVRLYLDSFADLNNND